MDHGAVRTKKIIARVSLAAWCDAECMWYRAPVARLAKRKGIGCVPELLNSKKALERVRIAKSKQCNLGAAVNAMLNK